MKQRLLTGWTFTRALYTIIGIVLIVQSILIRHWFGILFGANFASMGLFSLRCASGNGCGGQCNLSSKKPFTDLPEAESWM